MLPPKRREKIMAKGYIYAELEITDPAGYQAYRDGVGATITAFGGRYLIRLGNPETLEGDRTVTRAVLLEFESRARALEWYNSDEYRDLKALRQRTAKTNALVLSGYDDA
jgi:uncharacterized protein (DUF1330 family)